MLCVCIKLKCKLAYIVYKEPNLIKIAKMPPIEEKYNGKITVKEKKLLWFLRFV